MEKIKTLELYYSKYEPHGYMTSQHELKMQYTIFKTKQKALDTPTIDVDTWWNLVQNMLVINLEEIFVRHYANEKLYKRNRRLTWKDILNSCINP